MLFMRGLRRIAWNVMTAGSLVLCGAVGALWVRSYWMSDALSWRRPVTPRDLDWRGSIELRKTIQTWRGGLLYATDNMVWLPELDALQYDSFPVTGAPTPEDWEFCGFAHSRFGGGQYATPETDRRRIPFYAFVLLTAALPAARLAARLRRARRSAGTCGRCAYDLRATPDRCPECGATSASPPFASKPP